MLWSVLNIIWIIFFFTKVWQSFPEEKQQLFQLLIKFQFLGNYQAYPTKRLPFQYIREDLSPLNYCHERITILQCGWIHHYLIELIYLLRLTSLLLLFDQVVASKLLELFCFQLRFNLLKFQRIFLRNL